MVVVTPRARALLKLLALFSVLALAWLAFRHVPVRELLSSDGLGQLRATLRDAWWGSVAYVVLYAVLSALNFSGLVLTLAGGALFGFWRGALLNTIGANLGATGAFWLARALGREGLRALVGDRLSGLDRLAAAQGPMWLLRLRLIPVVPFNLLNLAAGLTAMPWPGYAAVTAIGILPGTLVYTYFADALVAGVAGGARAALVRVLLAGGLLVILSFLPGVARRLRWVEDLR
ncbi:MAG: TVP38/TMEM64 family protein [Gemmatimonadales bacterium]